MKCFCVWHGSTYYSSWHIVKTQQLLDATVIIVILTNRPPRRVTSQICKTILFKNIFIYLSDSERARSCLLAHSQMPTIPEARVRNPTGGAT